MEISVSKCLKTAVEQRFSVHSEEEKGIFLHRVPSADDTESNKGFKYVINLLFQENRVFWWCYYFS